VTTTHTPLASIGDLSRSPERTDVQPGAGHRVTRRRIQQVLGLLWLLDGVLQLQPFMFTKGFASQVIEPTAVGQPVWVAWPVHHGASVVVAHPVPVDLLFAGVQLALGIGFLWPRTVRTAALVSVAWAGGVWLFGEGLGGLAGGKAALFTGAPGAAVLYAVLALAAWPAPRRRSATRPPASGGVATWFPVAWAIIWGDLALLAVLPANRSAAAVSDQVTGSIGDVPAWLGHLDRMGGQVVHHLGWSSVLVLAVVPLAIGLLGLGPLHLRRWAAGSGIFVAVVAWAIGQSFGLLGSGMATDPNTGPLLALCGVALLGVRPSIGVPIRSARAEVPGRQAVGQAPGVAVS